MKRLLGRALVTVSVFASSVGFAPGLAHAAGPTLTVGDVAIAEGDAGAITVKVPVDLSAKPTGKVTVHYTVSSNDATAGTDFVAASGTLLFRGTNLAQSVDVTILGDRAPEADESVNVRLDSVVGAATVGRNGAVTIRNDDDPSDPPPDPAEGPTVALGDVTVVEGDFGKHYAYLPMTLSEPPTAPVVVNVFYTCGTAAANALFGATPTRTVTFSAGQQSATLSFLIPANTAPSAVTEFFEGMKVQVGDATFVEPDGSVIVEDNDGVVGTPSYPVSRVSVATGGDETHTADSITCQLGFGSFTDAVSADGRYALFTSDAYDIVPGDTNDTFDVFLRDRVANTTERVSVGTGGAQWSRGADSTAFMSADANEIAFATTAVEIVPAGASIAVYVRDRAADTTTLVSVLPDGTPATGVSQTTGISADGRFVAFLNGRDLYVRDVVAATTRPVVTLPSSAWNVTPLTADGSQIAFVSADDTLVPGDTNAYTDVFVRNLTTGATERVNVTSTGAQEQQPTLFPTVNNSRVTMSPDGRYVTFVSRGSNFVPSGAGVFVRDRLLGVTEKISVGVPTTKPLCFASEGGVSDDGRYVVFRDLCENAAGSVIDAKATGIWVRDRVAGTTRRVDVTYNGKVPTAGGGNSMISADGHTVIFDSAATNLIPADTNSARDVFVATVG